MDNFLAVANSQSDRKDKSFVELVGDVAGCSGDVENPAFGVWISCCEHRLDLANRHAGLNLWQNSIQRSGYEGFISCLRMQEAEAQQNGEDGMLHNTRLCLTIGLGDDLGGGGAHRDVTILRIA